MLRLDRHTAVFMQLKLLKTKDFLPFIQSYMPHPRAAEEQPTPSV